MQKRILIPKDRMAVLIGRRGITKRLIEKNTATQITIDTDIQIEGEAIEVMTAENVILAIGRGFSPKNAFNLIDEENTMVIIELPRNDKAMRRARSRIIGSSGKARKNLEEYTKTKISVYGKTVSIIGSYDGTATAKKAIEKLIKGLTHKAVYKFLEDEIHKNKKELI